MIRSVLLVGLCAALISCSNPPAKRGAVGVEATLLAPCCFNGTLDAHDSDLARMLRLAMQYGEPVRRAIDTFAEELVGGHSPVAGFEVTATEASCGMLGGTELTRLRASVVREIVDPCVEALRAT